MTARKVVALVAAVLLLLAVGIAVTFALWSGNGSEPVTTTR